MKIIFTLIALLLSFDLCSAEKRKPLILYLKECVKVINFGDDVKVTNPNYSQSNSYKRAQDIINIIVPALISEKPSTDVVDKIVFIKLLLDREHNKTNIYLKTGYFPRTNYIFQPSLALDEQDIFNLEYVNSRKAIQQRKKIMNGEITLEKALNLENNYYNYKIDACRALFFIKKEELIKAKEYCTSNEARKVIYKLCIQDLGSVNQFLPEPY